MNDHSGVAGILGLGAAVAVFFLLRKFFPSLAKVFLSLGIAAAVVVVLLVVMVLFFAFRKPKEPEKDWKQKEQDAVLAKGRANLLELRKLSLKIKHPRIRKLSEELCSSIEKILRTLKDHPQDILRARRFLNESLPMMGSILTTYKKLEDSGVPVEESAAKTEACLQDLQAAMEKQYASLFTDEVLDMAVEMETLKMVCRREGFMPDEPAEAKEEETEGVTLTL